MAIYPSYVEVRSSSRQTPVGVGCRSKKGLLITSIKQRENGNITKPFEINQYTTEEDGVLKCVTDVYYLGELIKSHVTDY